jgi:hypothetical protein
MTSSTFRFHGAIYRWLRTSGSSRLSRRGRIIAEVVPDERYPSMFRVKLLGRPISDMVNLSRAKDAALRLADHALQPSPMRRRAPPMRSDVGAATTLAAAVRRIGVPTKRKIGDGR